MCTRIVRSGIALVLCLIIWAVPLRASPGALDAPTKVAQEKLAPALRHELARMHASERVPIIIMMQERADLGRLDAEINAAGLGRRERSDIVVAALKDVASRSQPPLRARIAAWEATGRASDVRALWLVNAFTLQATPTVVRDIAARSDVERIFLDGILELDEPVDERPADMQPGQAEPGLSVVNAPALWELGYTGAGVIVMNIDTGVQGNHAALADRWLGNDPTIPADEAWFDPFQQVCPTPCDYSYHGTHTMGTIAGLDPAVADTTGVAFGASWIAAATLVGMNPHTSLSLQAFEWAIDGGTTSPSRPPADVICCSWSDRALDWEEECGSAATYWEVIDNFETTGGAVIFSAGNDGPGPMTITPPKNRITTQVNIWATGAINGHVGSFPIADFSSRGPSRCDNVTIKPEAVAPGVDVRAPAPTGYRLLSGTSMAAPHVAGVVALLMEAFPEATGTEIKLALIATARDLGPPGEDNTYGKGLIDAGAAYEWLLQVGAIKEQMNATPWGAVSLSQNVPNPFNPSTSISYDLPTESTVMLKVINCRGQVVAVLSDGVRRPPGTHTSIWNGLTLTGQPAPSGMYAFRLMAEASSHAVSCPVIRTCKAILIK